jgi:tetratricopeptide (TPR) repeat protein
LQDTSRWGPLASAAAAIADAGGAGALQTPLQQRLAASLVAWGADPALDLAEPHDLALALATRLAQRRDGRRLWVVWQRLALERLEADADILNAVGGSSLDALGDFTLREVLLDGGNRLHDVLRRVAEERPVDPDLRGAQRAETHQILFEHHLAKVSELSGADDPAAASHAGEALHHAGELGDESRQDLVSVDLTDQLNALGHRRSTVHGDYAGAAAVFLRAIQVDGDDAYALHHRGHSLDALGENASEVDARYREALARDPSPALWNARWIAFLVDTARIEEARRAWAQAEAAVPDERDDPEWYRELHLPVAASLLNQGELAFAAYVLDGVPDWARNPLYDELDRALEGRLAAQDSGAFVPAPRSGTEWWQQPPARLPARDTAGRVLSSWMASRVEAVDDEGVHLHVARVDMGAGTLRPGLLTISRDTWEARVLDDVTVDELRAGRFIEVGSYESADGGATAIAVLPQQRVPRTPASLDPGRWLTGVVGGPPNR